MICSKCAAPNPDGSKFCSTCGAALLASPQTQATIETDEQANPSAPAPEVPATQAEPPAQTIEATSAAAPSNAPNAATPTAADHAAPPAQPAPPVQPGIPTAPAPTPSSTTPIDAKLKKQIIIAVSAAVGLVVLAIIIAVTMVNCSGGGKPNTSDLVNADSEKVVSAVEGLSVVSLYKSTYYTPENMKDTIAACGKAFYNKSVKDAQNLVEDVKKQSPWAICFYEQSSSNLDFKNLTISDIKGKGDPAEASVVTYRAPEKMSPADALRIAREFARIDSVTIGSEPTSAGLKEFGDNTYYFGVGRGPGTLVRIRVDKISDIYEITVYTYNQSKLKDDTVDKLVSKFEDGFDSYFKTKFTA